MLKGRTLSTNSNLEQRKLFPLPVLSFASPSNEMEEIKREVERVAARSPPLGTRHSHLQLMKTAEHENSVSTSQSIPVLLCPGSTPTVSSTISLSLPPSLAPRFFFLPPSPSPFPRATWSV